MHPDCEKVARGRTQYCAAVSFSGSPQEVPHVKFYVFTLSIVHFPRSFSMAEALDASWKAVIVSQLANFSCVEPMEVVLDQGGRNKRRRRHLRGMRNQLYNKHMHSQTLNNSEDMLQWEGMEWMAGLYKPIDRYVVLTVRLVDMIVPL